LNGLFALLRSFDENASEIFRKFEMFAYDFIDRTRPPAPGLHSACARLEFRASPSNFAEIFERKRATRRFGNRPFTMSRGLCEILILSALIIPRHICIWRNF
jgi:hypothetical protein